MKPISIYKKCLCCGKVAVEQKQCQCGGHLYMIGTVYQPGAMKGDK